MKNGESLKDVITRFTRVVKELMSYTTKEHVDKVLQIDLDHGKSKLLL